MSSEDKDVMEALTQLKNSSLLKLETNHSLAKEAIESYYNYVTVNPEVAKEALEILSIDSNKIYLDYLERLTRLNEEVSQRLMDASNIALKKAIEKKKPKSARMKTKVTVKPKSRTSLKKTVVKPKTQTSLKKKR